MKKHPLQKHLFIVQQPDGTIIESITVTSRADDDAADLAHQATLLYERFRIDPRCSLDTRLGITPIQ